MIIKILLSALIGFALLVLSIEIVGRILNRLGQKITVGDLPSFIKTFVEGGRPGAKLRVLPLNSKCIVELRQCCTDLNTGNVKAECVVRLNNGEDQMAMILAILDKQMFDESCIQKESDGSIVLTCPNELSSLNKVTRAVLKEGLRLDNLSGLRVVFLGPVIAK